MGCGILKNRISAINPSLAICGLPRDLAKRCMLGNENYDREFYTGLFEPGEITTCFIFFATQSVTIDCATGILEYFTDACFLY